MLIRKWIDFILSKNPTYLSLNDSTSNKYVTNIFHISLIIYTVMMIHQKLSEFLGTNLQKKIVVYPNFSSLIVQDTFHLTNMASELLEEILLIICVSFNHLISLFFTLCTCKELEDSPTGHS